MIYIMLGTYLKVLSTEQEVAGNVMAIICKAVFTAALYKKNQKKN